MLSVNVTRGLYTHGHLFCFSSSNPFFSMALRWRSRVAKPQRDRGWPSLGWSCSASLPADLDFLTLPPTDSRPQGVLVHWVSTRLGHGTQTCGQSLLQMFL